MRKVVFIATVESHILRFHLHYLKYFHEQGYEVHVICRGDSAIPYCDKKHTVLFERFPFCLHNLKAYIKLKQIMKEHQFDIVHCHTPVGGVLGRLAAQKLRKTGTKVLYTAHGFHFCKNGPKKDWLLYFPVEWALSKITDCLITINQEDYSVAKRFFSPKKLCLVYGVGYDRDKFSVKKEKVSNQYFVLLYVGDLSKRKNQGFLIRAAAVLKQRIPNLKVLLVGPDTANGMYWKLAVELDVLDCVEFLGERNDVTKLLQVANVSVTCARREGLAGNVIEAMLASQCVVASNVRGNADLIVDGETGFLFELDNREQFCEIIMRLYQNPELVEKIGKQANERVDRYTLTHIDKEMTKIYQAHMID